jgi:beta-barrel assembly-enhancing protease
MLELSVNFTRNSTQTFLQKTAIVLASVSTLAWMPNGGLPVSAQSKPIFQKTPIVQTQPESTVEEPTLYERAESELSENYYILYRIVELIARVNNLDDRPWRVAISPVEDASEYEINAFATQSNLIHFYEGLLDQVAGDVSALACVVGHEMAHLELQHIPISQAKLDKAIEEIKQIDDLDDREKRLEEFLEEFGELNRSQELEADAIGYQYAIAAGFEPEGCLRMLDVLSRLPGSLRDSLSHPAVPDRIEAIQNLIESSSVLENTNNSELDNTEPLTYQWLDAAQQLRINSSRGGSFGEDWDKLFGRNSEEN